MFSGQRLIIFWTAQGTFQLLVGKAGGLPKPGQEVHAGPHRAGDHSLRPARRVVQQAPSLEAKRAARFGDPHSGTTLKTTPASSNPLKISQTIRQLQRRLDHDSKLQDFLGVKGQRRLMTDLENREAKKRAQAEERLREQLAMYRETLTQIQVRQAPRQEIR